MEKTNWVLYNATSNNGGSCGKVIAANYDDVVEQVEKLGTDTRRGMSAQNNADYSQIVRWYPDGVRTIMVGGFELPYNEQDIA